MFANLLDYVRIALYVLLAMVALFAFEAWQKEHPSTPAPAITQTVSAPDGRFVPEVATTQPAAAVAPALKPSITPPSATGKIVTVSTDLLNVRIDTQGGDIVGVDLIKYPESLGSKKPFLLLNDDATSRYLAESGLLSKTGPDTSAQQGTYTVAETSYELTPNTNELVVKLNWEKNGLHVTKLFTFVRGSYEIRVGYEVDNQSTALWNGSLYTQLLRTNTPPASSGGFVNLATYFGAAVSTPAKPFEKITFKQMKEKNLSMQTQDGWASMIQHYFISAWVPPTGVVSNYYSRVTDSGLYTIGMIGPQLSAPPGSKIATEAKLYTGPAIASMLDKTAPSLSLTIDYGWFWFISNIIFWMLDKVHDVIGNWGWSIVVVTVIIKLLFYKLSEKSYRSMSSLKKLQPRIEQLKERYGDDKQKMTQATLELYKQEKVNPMSGCLPILIQIPVFIALYWVLVESVQLRQAPWIFWIHDLSRQDPYYILPVLMGISMFIQQRLNPPPPDPLQAKVMMLMPVVFTVLFANFPAGLMLYWFVNNTLSFLQQWHVMHRVNKAS